MAKQTIVIKETVSYFHEITVQVSTGLTEEDNVQGDIEAAIGVNGVDIQDIADLINGIYGVSVVSCKVDDDGGVPEFEWHDTLDAEE